MKSTPKSSLTSAWKASLRIGIVTTTVLLTACASNGNKQDAEPIKQEDYPTLATVEYVIECMNKKGGQNLTNLYQCSCQFDRFSELMTYEQYSQAVVFRNLKGMPGENGQPFRNTPQAKAMRTKLQNAQQLAQEQCEVSQNVSSK